MVLRGVQNGNQDPYRGFCVLELFFRRGRLVTSPRFGIDVIPMGARQEIPRQVPYTRDYRREMIPSIPKPVVARLVAEYEHQAHDDR